MRIIFAGTPEFAATNLQALLDACGQDHQLVAVYTQPDRPAGRGRKLTPSPVKALAAQHGIPVLQPPTLKDEAAQQELRDLQPDLMIVVAYGLLLPQAVLDIPRRGCINVHASLLPRWRGAAPIQRALLTGDAETGVTLMQMEAGLDTGPMLLKTHCPITPDDTSASLHDKLARQGGDALQQLLPLLLAGTLQAEPQNPQLATYAAKLTKDEARINWQRPAADIERAIRGYNPWPVAWFTEGEDVIRAWDATPLNIDHNATPGTLLDIEKDGLILACGAGCLKLTRLQLPGSRQMSAADLLNGHPDRFAIGQVFA